MTKIMIKIEVEVKIKKVISMGCKITKKFDKLILKKNQQK